QIILQASHEINKPQVLSNWNKLKFRIMEYFIVAKSEVIGEIAAKMFGINIKILDYTQSGRKYFFEIKMTKNRKSVKFSYGPVTASTLEAAIPSVYEILCFLIDDKEGREFGLAYRSSPLFTMDKKKYQRVNEILGDDIHGIKSLLIR
ncbi:MAG: hypothetical protein NZM44_04510, partial [Candidatus Calescibacterium sp.]|nr:hypothetical protein [Candidatus Calescibacterium sp.]